MEQLSHMTTGETICAISTPAGVGGIAVIRISGDDALKIVSKVWKGKDLATVPGHTAHLGRIVYPNGEILDEVVATVFRAPHSFTGEDVVELSCHGSVYIQQQLILLLIDSGCRAAEGGEFTRRAFMNGLMDLSQAEAVADVIAASSRASLRVAVSQMRGGFSRRLRDLREQLLEFVSLMELELDFSEEDVEFADRSRLVNLAERIIREVGALADSFSAGNAIRNGVPVAIIGETNAGKSTLLNRLLHDDKALVSNIKGTTRDAIEDTCVLGGITFRFIDTAGIRHTSDTVEAMGIEKTYRKIKEARIVVWMVDGEEGPEHVAQVAAEIRPSTAGKQLIAVVNKIDSLSEKEQSAMVEAVKREASQATIICISAKDDIGVNKLEQQLAHSIAMPDSDPDAVVVTNARHYQALLNARTSLQRALDGLRNGLPGDLVSQDVRECIHHLGEITGEITTHEVLGSIFSRFCVGK